MRHVQFMQFKLATLSVAPCTGHFSDFPNFSQPKLNQPNLFAFLPFSFLISWDFLNFIAVCEISFVIVYPFSAADSHSQQLFDGCSFRMRMAVDFATSDATMCRHCVLCVELLQRASWTVRFERVFFVCEIRA